MRRLICGAALASLCLALAACIANPTVISVDSAPPPAKLDGILTRTSRPPAELVRIFLTHGMGTHSRDYCALATVVAGLADALHVRQQPVAQPIGMCGNLAVQAPRSITVAGVSDTAELFTFDFVGSDNARLAQFSFLLWAPLTKPIKDTLGETNHPSWATLTTLSKSFFQTHLSDVVLYGGTYRGVVRAAVEKALCFFVGGTPDDNDATICNGGTANEETVLITHSLGGYMLFDAIADLRAAHSREEAGAPRASEHNAAAKALARTDLIFMLANQLALLDLSTLTQWPPPTAAQSTALTSPEEAQRGNALRAFARHWDAYHATHSRRQIVAISDPNDILSYLVSSGDVPSSNAADPTVIANVYLGVARNWFGLFAWPPDAHLNYLTNSDVMDIIACGMTGNTINACPRR